MGLPSTFCPALNVEICDKVGLSGTFCRSGADVSPEKSPLPFPDRGRREVSAPFPGKRKPKSPLSFPDRGQPRSLPSPSGRGAGGEGLRRNTHAPYSCSFPTEDNISYHPYILYAGKALRESQNLLRDARIAMEAVSGRGFRTTDDSRAAISQRLYRNPRQPTRHRARAWDAVDRGKEPARTLKKSRRRTPYFA
jgi:hypothetical protein